MEKTISIHNKTGISARGKLNSKHCKPVICIETGEVFTSVTDAAEKAGIYPQNLSAHLTGNKKTFAGKHYCYLSKATENLDSIVARLRETSEDARKWREYQAEQDAIRMAEEKRIADELKAKADYEAAVEKVTKKIESCRKICSRLEQQYNKATARTLDAENAYKALTGHAYGESYFAEYIRE